jgi:hypothetical protein
VTVLEMPPLRSQPSPLFSRALYQLLNTNRNMYNSDLIDDFLEEVPWIETQINVRTDIGEARTRRLPSRTVHYRVHGNTVFNNIRFPRRADTCPEWDEARELHFPLKVYAAEIGTTWLAKSGSLRVVFDVDHVWGHANGLSEGEVQKIDRAVEGIEYAELRRSTSGAGRHIHLLLSGIQVANHTEHAALARALLGKLCADAGLDFAPQVDCCGGNTWFWSRRATNENRGFELLKPATRRLTAAELPANWKDHIEVVSRKRSRIRVHGLATGADEDTWAELASGYSKVKPDEEHKRILDAYAQSGYGLSHNPDVGCYYMHTKGLEEVHRELGLKGYFITESEGTDPLTANCYVFLRSNGMFYVVRFKTQQEHVSWGRTANGERCCSYNCPMDLKTACQAVGGVWMGDKGVTCHEFTKAKELARMFGFDLPPLNPERPVTFHYLNAQTIAAETRQLNGETPAGWGIAYRKLLVTFDVEPPAAPQHDFDSVARHVVTAERENAGWLMRADDGIWNWEPKDTVKDRVAEQFGISRSDLTQAMGKIAGSPYRLVNEPFQPEFLPGRRWNKFGAQLDVAPTYGNHHPHYDLIFTHAGRGLDDAVHDDPWCKRHGVQDGSDFLMIWAALMIRVPKQHLPLLYFYSDERDNGKSAIYKALGLLFAQGYVEGVRMLNEPFNKMLAGAVLIYLDEEKVEARHAQKVKLYIDSDRVSIRMMRTDSFMFDNFTHWIACYNLKDGLPVENRDERIIMIHVPPLFDDEKLDWRKEMRPALKAERSDFLGTLMTREIPSSGGRLYLPLLSTQLKQEVMAASADAAAATATCDREELLARVVEVMQEKRIFCDKSRKLLKLLGPGSWEGSPNHLRQYLREIEAPLLEQGIQLDLSNTRRIGIEVVSRGNGSV